MWSTFTIVIIRSVNKWSNSDDRHSDKSSGQWHGKICNNNKINKNGMARSNWQLEITHSKFLGSTNHNFEWDDRIRALKLHTWAKRCRAFEGTRTTSVPRLETLPDELYGMVLCMMSPVRYSWPSGLWEFGGIGGPTPPDWGLPTAAGVKGWRPVQWPLVKCTIHKCELGVNAWRPVLPVFWEDFALVFEFCMIV